MNNPTRIDAGLKAVMNVRRENAGIVIAFDPNTGTVEVNVQGFVSAQEELGVLEYAKVMRGKFFMDMNKPETKSHLITPVSGVLPRTS